MCKCDDCIKEFIVTVCNRIATYDPNNRDIFLGFHRGKGVAFEILVDATKEFYGEEFATDTIYALVTKRLEELK